MARASAQAGLPSGTSRSSGAAVGTGPLPRGCGGMQRRHHLPWACRSGLWKCRSLAAPSQPSESGGERGELVGAGDLPAGTPPCLVQGGEALALWRGAPCSAVPKRRSVKVSSVHYSRFLSSGA